MHFETWLVCVIDSHRGPDSDTVRDDRYEVAPLLGWKWGFDIAYQDAGRVGLAVLEDFTYALMPFEFVTTPTEDFKAGLDAVFGDRVADRFHIRLGDSAGCMDRGR
jgi:hypothetical protein